MKNQHQGLDNVEISLSSIRAGDIHKGFGANFDELPDVEMSESSKQHLSESEGELPPPREMKPVLFEPKPLEPQPHHHYDDK